MNPTIAVIGFVVWLAGVATASAGDTQDYKVGDLTVGHPWARASAGKAKAGAAYITITNNGTQVDRLVKVASPVAKRATLHTQMMDGDVMKMRPVKAVEVSPGEPTVFKPGGLHVMLMGLKSPLREGETFAMTLTFEKAEVVEVTVTVMKVGAMKPGRRHGKGSPSG